MSVVLLAEFTVRFRTVPSAWVARDRLLRITRQDRERCGDGRWVRVPEFVVCGILPIPTHAAFAKKPFYRWEPRR